MLKEDHGADTLPHPGLMIILHPLDEVVGYLCIVRIYPSSVVTL